MTARVVAAQRARARVGNGISLLRLGWAHFWLLSGILGGMLGLVALVFFVYISTR